MKTEIAVAAGLLVLALAAPAAASPREYNRGYRDCLNGQFDEDEGSRAYREGCRDAQREQGGGGGPPGWGQDGGPGYGGGGPGWGQNGGPGFGGGGPGWGQNGGGGGWGQNGGGPRPGAGGGVPNVAGMQPGQVLGAMAARGFRNVGTEVAGGAINGFYFNPGTGECVQVASVNGRAVGASPSSNSRCR